MVLESLFEGESIVKHPLSALFLGFVFSSVSVWIAFFSFPSSASILAISFITIAAVPMIHYVFILEESALVKKKTKKNSFVGRNFDLIKIYTCFTIGIIVSFATWFVLLPPAQTAFCIEENKCLSIPSKEVVFKEQSNALSRVSALASGAPEGMGKATQSPSGVCGNDFWCWFNLIFVNNSSLMLMAVLLSFLFGAGALFLITWNASIVGTLIGQNIVAEYHWRFLGLLPHGIPEFGGYFMGAISGGMISVALTKKNSSTKEFELIARDSFILLLLALFSLLIGGAVEAAALTGEDTLGLFLSVFYVLFMGALIAKTQL